jgi:glyoxylate reductase
MRPTVFVTRQLPEPVMNRLSEVCDFRVGAKQGELPREALLAGVREADGLVCLLTDTVDPRNHRSRIEAARHCQRRCRVQQH